MPTPPLRPHLTEWLSLIRYQALAAAELSRQPLPVGGTAINGLQDAVEAFLRLCVEHLGVPVPNKSDFIQVFDAVDRDPSVDGALAGHRFPLLALNAARVDFKHHGNVPSTTTLERSRVNVFAFLDEATPIALGLKFDEVSLAAFIRDQQARQFADQADQEWKAGDLEEAMGSLAKSFDRIVQDYEARKVGPTRQSLFVTRPTFLDTQNVGWLGLDKLMDWIQAIDQRSKLLAFGVDLRRYTFFQAHTPAVRLWPDGYRLSPRRNSVPPTDEVFRRCYGFVIDSALTLGAEDYDFDALAARQTDQQQAG